jgi:GTP-binding protein YchF
MYHIIDEVNMGLKAGIVGLPNVGKSTLFNAITNASVEAANYPFATINPNTGVVAVQDVRLDFLSSLFKPKKTIATTVEFVDIAGLVKGAAKGEGLGNQFLAAIREADAIVQVVRCFDSSEIIHVENSVNPERDMDIINLELILSDLDTIQRRLDKVNAKARGNDKQAIVELAMLQILKPQLLDGIPARLANLTSEQRILIDQEYHLLTNKPILYVANIAEDGYGSLAQNAYYQQVLARAKKEGAEVVAISCEIESQISKLPQQEKLEFLNTLGIKEPGLNPLVRATYQLLKLATYFTVGEDECRAWTFHQGMTAPQAAGVIHTDFQKGFIKAEIYHYEDMVKFKSELAVKEAGKLRMEGKEYVVKDGDVIFFRFNV